MFRIHAAQAQHGDALLIETEYANKPRFVLVDGGTPHTLHPHLTDTLREQVVPKGATLDLVAVSHIDADHVSGVLDLFVELRSAKDDGEKPYLKIREIWHNSFGEDITAGTDIETRLADVMSVIASLRRAAVLSQGSTHALGLLEKVAGSIDKGAALQREARLLKVPRNKRFAYAPIVATGTKKDDTRRVYGLSLRIVGPTKANLDELKDEWEEWLKEQEEKARDGTLDLTAMSDDSVPNLSSLQFLATKTVDGVQKTALFTGDGRGDHLLEALTAAGLVDASGGIDVDLLKVPHHGSDRNVTPEWFEKVRARKYLISGDGTVGKNPDLTTLKWIVDAAKAQKRQIRLYCTNETKNTKALVQQRPPAAHGYAIEYRPAGDSYLTVDV